MADKMGWPEFRSLVTEMADELGARRHEEWTIRRWHEDSYYPGADLIGPASARLEVQYQFHAAGKITIAAKFPAGTSHKRAFSANVSPERGPRAMASAADTRVLRAGYLDVLPGKVEQHEREVRREADRADWLERAAELFGMSAADAEHGKLPLSQFLDKRADVEVNGGFGEHEPFTFSLDLCGVSPKTALAMLRVLADAAEVQARCCHRYGPGHDQRLSQLGCLHTELDCGPQCRAGKVTHAEGSALFDLYRRSGATQSWQDWLGEGAANIHEAWR